MSRTFAKRDTRTLQAVRDDGSVTEYNYEFLQRQRQRIKTQRANELAMRESELAEVEELLRHCDRLGVNELGKTKASSAIAKASEADASEIEPLPPAPKGVLKRLWKHITTPI